MGFYYRKRRGPFYLSWSRRGPRIGTSVGCLVPLMVGVVIVAVLMS